MFGLALLQIKTWLDDLPIPFPYAIYSASNIDGCFAYNIVSYYASFF